MTFSHRYSIIGVLVTLIITPVLSAPKSDEIWSLKADNQAVSWIDLSDGSRKPGSITAEGHVSIKRPDMQLTAESLLANMADGIISQLKAGGGVDLVTPSQELHCDELTATVSPEGKIINASLTNVNGKTGQLLVRAESTTISGNNMQLKTGQITVCALPTPHYALKANTININTVTRRVTARNVRLMVYGHTILSLPYISTGVGRKRNSTLMPIVTYTQGKGVGVRYPIVIPMKDSMVTGRVAVYERDQAELSMSYDQRLDQTGDNEQMDRLQDGDYEQATFMSVPTEAPAELKTNASWFVTADVNRPIYLAQDNTDEVRVNSTELGARYDTRTSKYGWMQAELRTGSVREEPTMEDHFRSSIHARWSSVPVKILPVLDYRVGTEWRAVTYSSGDQINRITGQFMLDGKPESWMEYTLGYASAKETGRSPFSFDRLTVKHEGIARLLIGQGTRIDARGYWDFDKSAWIDVTIALKIRAHCIEPELIWSQKMQSVEFNLDIATF
ncbi:MAG: hypothetical protein ACYC1M_02275 [Armatimonadota bacterium]